MCVRMTTCVCLTTDTDIFLPQELFITEFDLNLFALITTSISPLAFPVHFYNANLTVYLFYYCCVASTPVT